MSQPGASCSWRATDVDSCISAAQGAVKAVGGVAGRSRFFCVVDLHCRRRRTGGVAQRTLRTAAPVPDAGHRPTRSTIFVREPDCPRMPGGLGARLFHRFGTPGLAQFRTSRWNADSTTVGLFTYRC